MSAAARSPSVKQSGSAAMNGNGTAQASSPRIKKEEDDAVSPATTSSDGPSTQLKAETNGRASPSVRAAKVAGSSSQSGSRPASPPPPTTYRDIPLYSTSLDDWHYHLMRLASHSRIDPSDAKRFPWPVKLNRKLPPRLKENAPRAGDPVVDQFGRPIMAPPKAGRTNDPNVLPQDKRKAPLRWPGPNEDTAHVEELLARIEALKGPQADASLIGPSTGSNNATRAKGGIFKKRVREIHKASAVARKTHNEEALPWILEDRETGKEWEGRRAESRRGFSAFKEAIQAKKEKGTPMPTRPSLADEEADKAEAAASVKKEDPGVKDEGGAAHEQSTENHAPWIGKLEGEAHESGSTAAGGAMSHALFVFDERGSGAFRVVPVSRMYKFIQKPKHASKMTWEEAEKAFEQHQKARIGESMGSFGAFDSASSSSPVVRRLRQGDSSNGEFGPALSLPGVTGNRGRGGFKSDPFANISDMYSRDSSARRNHFRSVKGENDRNIRVKDEEGTYGELAFEEDFADDEERNEGDDYAMGEEETRELEQRMKRELARAEERHERGEDEDDFGDDLFGDRGRPGQGENDVLTGSGKQMKKIMKALARREGNEAYEDDDEERNPYASDDSEEDDIEDSVMANPEEALRLVREEREREERDRAKQQQQQEQANGKPSTTASKSASRSGTPAPTDKAASAQSRPSTGSGASGAQTSTNVHRPGAGHANFAQRATSPTRAQSRQGSRSGSPDLGGTSTPSSSLKRKSDLNPSAANAQTNPQMAGNGKRARTGATHSASSRTSSPGSGSPRSASPSRSGGRIPLSEVEREILDLVRKGTISTTKELITYFAPRLSSRLGSQGSTLRQALLEGARRVLQTSKAGTLEARPGFGEQAA